MRTEAVTMTNENHEGRKCLWWACCQKNNPNNYRTTAKVRLTAILSPLSYAIPSASSGTCLTHRLHMATSKHLQQGIRALNCTLVIFHGKSLGKKFKGSHSTKLTSYLTQSWFFFQLH